MINDIGELYKCKYNTDLFVFVGIVDDFGCFYNIRTGERLLYTLDYINHFFISL
jgi:hypothetical protein